MKDIIYNYSKQIVVPASLALVFAMPLSVQAQGAGEQPPTEGGGQPPAAEGAGGANIDGQTKEKFVAAYVEIRDVQQEYTEKLQNVDDEGKARELQQQAQAEMVEIVEDNGMSVEEYNQLVGAISNDPELRKEIEQKARAQ
ncbi:MAG: DUF4168 domain-containing protein [Gammaproteobacteria bacterium]|nr:DUF4168 domain-containing protein [Gammaproteobacteria bacterium]